MKKICNFFLIAVMALCFTSCGSNDGQGFYIGKSKGYSDFLWSKYNWDQVVLPTQSLQLDMGDIAFTQPIKLQVVYLDENGNYLPVNSSKGRYITVLRDGKLGRAGAEGHGWDPDRNGSRWRCTFLCPGCVPGNGLAGAGGGNPGKAPEWPE